MPIAAGTMALPRNWVPIESTGPGRFSRPPLKQPNTIGPQLKIFQGYAVVAPPSAATTDMPPDTPSNFNSGQDWDCFRLGVSAINARVSRAPLTDEVAAIAPLNAFRCARGLQPAAICRHPLVRGKLTTPMPTRGHRDGRAGCERAANRFRPPASSETRPLTTNGLPLNGQGSLSRLPAIRSPAGFFASRQLSPPRNELKENRGWLSPFQWRIRRCTFPAAELTHFMRLFLGRANWSETSADLIAGMDCRQDLTIHSMGSEFAR